MSDLFQWNREPAERFAGALLEVLEGAWQFARALLLNAGVTSADQTTYMDQDPEHMGDAAHRIDLMLHQWIDARLMSAFLGMRTAGEENPPNGLLLDPQFFNHIAYIDALDGSRQAFVLPGAWSINLVVQRYLGLDRITATPRCCVSFIGSIDAEGVSVHWTPAIPGVQLQLAGNGNPLPLTACDQLLVADGEEFGVTGDTTVLAGGYKTRWWDDFRSLREAVLDVPAFNTAGAPVARKAIQNADVVVVELNRSTLWDGIAAGLIAGAGGYVCELGQTEALPAETVMNWFNEFGYERRAASRRLKERYPVPGFVAGMDGKRVENVAHAACKAQLI